MNTQRVISAAIAMAITMSGYVLGVIAVGWLSSAAHAQGEAADTLASQLRRQGHRCEDPVKVERDAKRSRPDEAVWIVRCANDAYRMRLIPNSAAHVEQI
jgi:hypothetical protein